MDQTTVTAIASSVAVGLGLLIANARQSKKNRDLAGKITPVLRDDGPQTLLGLADKLGMGGFYARGKVVLALNDMAAQGTVEVIPAPEGTPQLQKVKFIQYRLRG
jgi:hypothetical protein